MGSRGTDRFSDYSGSESGSSGGRGGQGGGAAGHQPTSSVDECERALGDIPLEEVARCEYFASHKTVPPAKTLVVVRSTLEGGRVAVETKKNPQVIGYLPTRYLYLRKCIQQGWRYNGHVLSSSAGKNPSVRVDLAANKE